MGSDPQPQPPLSDTAGLLRCAHCGRTRTCAAEDLVFHARVGWPECCGRVMTLYLPAEMKQRSQSEDHKDASRPAH